MIEITTGYIGQQGPLAWCYPKEDITPRWGLGYVVTTIGASWEIGTEKRKL